MRTLTTAAWSDVPDGSGSLNGLFRSPSAGTKGGGKRKGGGGAKGTGKGRGREQASGAGKRGKGVRRAAGVGSPAEEGAEEGIVQVLRAPAKLTVILFEVIHYVCLGAPREDNKETKA